MLPSRPLWPFYRKEKASEDHGILRPFRDRNRVLLEKKHEVTGQPTTWSMIANVFEQFKIN